MERKEDYNNQHYTLGNIMMSGKCVADIDTNNIDIIIIDLVLLSLSHTHRTPIQRKCCEYSPSY